MDRVLAWLMYHTIRIRHNQETRWWVVLNILTSNFSDFETQSTKHFQTIDLKQKPHIVEITKAKKKSDQLCLVLFLGLTQFHFFDEKAIYTLFNYIRTQGVFHGIHFDR